MRVQNVRVPHLRLPEQLDTAWNPVFPEFAAAANAVSLLMPHVEPYVARSVRSVQDRLDEPLADEARAFVAQELQHQAQHRRLNQALVTATPGLARVDRWAGRAYRWLERRGSTRWSLAFAAGFETSAFALARWSEAHLRLLFDDADPAVRTLFLWHLAEEVEHKSVAFDVHQRIDGSRVRYLLAGWCSLLLLACFTWVGTVVQLWSTRRILSPVAWFRLVRWGLSLAFEVLPDLFAAAMPGHHPSQFSDPVLLVTWLEHFDPATGRDPLTRG
jgi:predicted metal-dependent hydrolase